MASGVIAPTRQLALSEIMLRPATELELAGLALALGARRVRGFSRAEARLCSAAPIVSRKLLADTRARIAAGEDPLGEEFCRLRTSAARRVQGATYTPPIIVRAMVDWAVRNGTPARVVDPGVGSARFLVAAGIEMPQAQLLGVDIDPLAALLSRANLAVSGLANRSEVRVCDYRAVVLPPVTGPTLFIGNPPYVRHHLIDAASKAWLSNHARQLGHSASQLAGLHVHFFLATSLLSRAGDYGAFITAAEWLDVNYGGLLRGLFVNQLGGERIVVIEPTALPFTDAATTAAVSYFKIGGTPKSIRLKRIGRVADLANHEGGRAVPRERMKLANRWSPLTRALPKDRADFVELGELCRVHRGQVTGLNRVWIAGEHSRGLPHAVLYPSVTRARELFLAGESLVDAERLRQVIDLPTGLDAFDGAERVAIERFLTEAKRLGASKGYVATKRKAWWSVGLREPAPILATYMARRPPAFVRNKARVRHINIAHGLYPRQLLSEIVLCNLVRYLRASVTLTEGRTYAGGLTKFEPREMERLLVPGLELLSEESPRYDRSATLGRS